jgi:hypothetical protein
MIKPTAKASDSILAMLLLPEILFAVCPKFSMSCAKWKKRRNPADS